MTEQHVYLREQSRHALNFQRAGFERAAQKYEHTALNEVDAAVARDTDMSRAEMLARLGALEQRAGFLDFSSCLSVGRDENRVASDALETHRKIVQ